MITISTIPVKEGQKSRDYTTTIGHAERILKTCKDWKIKDGSKYVFKDNAIVTKAKS